MAEGTGLLDAYGRPWREQEFHTSKWEVEGLASRLQPIIGSLFGGSHPFFQSEDSGFEGAKEMEKFRGFGDVISPYDSGHEYADGSGGGGSDSFAGISTQINDRFSHRNPVSQLNVPRDNVGVMTASMRYAEDNYIVYRGVKVKKNFALKDMTIRGSATTRDFYTDELKRLKLRYWLGQLFRYYWICGRVVCYWGEERPIKGLTILDPRLINVRRWMGSTQVFLRPDTRWRDVLTGLKKDSPEAKWLRKVLPKWWIPYVMKNEEIPLKDGTHALIENDLSLFSSRGFRSISGTPLHPAFNALQVLGMHMAGDFSVAWMMKNLIVLCSIGDPKNEKDYTRADQIELQKLQSLLQRPEYAMWAYVDPTVMIRFIHPDPKLYDSAKYTQPTQVIEYVMGLPPVFSSSATAAGSVDFNAASMSIKPFQEEIQCARQDVIDQLFSQLFPAMRDGYVRRKAGTKDPEVDFDQDALKDTKTVMDELTAKYDRGAVSVQSLLDGKAQDIDTERKRKTEENKEKSTWQPVFDMHHGNPDGTPGRPDSGGGNSQEKVTGTRTPRPSAPK